MEGEKIETVGFEDRADDFALVRIDADGNRSEIVLTAANLGALAKILPRQMEIAVARHISPNLAQQGVESIVPTEVVRMKLNTDLHQTRIHLGVQDHLQNEVWLSFAPQDAQTLHDHLPKWIAMVQSKSVQ
jgi:hypothetical protein